MAKSPSCKCKISPATVDGGVFLHPLIGGKHPMIYFGILPSSFWNILVQDIGAGFRNHPTIHSYVRETTETLAHLQQGGEYQHSARQPKNVGDVLVGVPERYCYPLVI